MRKAVRNIGGEIEGDYWMKGTSWIGFNNYDGETQWYWEKVELTIRRNWHFEER